MRNRQEVRECAACGASVMRSQATINRNRTGRFFCSESCRSKLGSKPRRHPDKACELCDKTFRPLSSNNVGRFCSKTCYDEWQRRRRVTIICLVCGTSVIRKHGEAVARSGHYCSKRCSEAGQVRNGLGRFHNGREAVINQDGYVLIWEPDHPAAYRNGRMFEHRWVVEQTLGRRLDPDDQVHHVNGIKTDNQPGNLAVKTAREHTLITLDEGSFRRRAARQRIHDLESQNRDLEVRLAAFESKVG